MRDPKIAVIGPFHNGAPHVRPWLEGMRSQTYENFALYLVDDGSKDQTPELLQEVSAELKLPAFVIPLSRNVGPAAARNLAISQALADGADVVLLLDSDCRVAPDWIERHAKFHQARSDVAILGGSLLGKSRSVVGKADGFCSWFTAVPFSRSGEVKRLHLSSTNMSVKSGAFEITGLFDQTLATGEDVAFCKKAQKNGLTLWFQSDILTTHLDRDNLSEAKRHHYRWGLHSFTLSRQEENGGYYGFLTRLNSPLLVALLVPIIAALNTVLILIQYSRSSPNVWLYLPWIFLLKWSNALGVYRGYLNPNLCLRPQVPPVGLSRTKAAA